MRRIAGSIIELAPRERDLLHRAKIHCRLSCFDADYLLHKRFENDGRESDESTQIGSGSV